MALFGLDQLVRNSRGEVFAAASVGDRKQSANCSLRPLRHHLQRAHAFSHSLGQKQSLQNFTHTPESSCAPGLGQNQQSVQCAPESVLGPTGAADLLDGYNAPEYWHSSTVAPRFLKFDCR
jgi:hypothetical protein